MDLVSMSHQQVAKKNGSLVNGLTNGSNGYTNGYKNGFANGFTNGHNFEIGHSEFMKIQRYQDLIGSTPLVDITSLASPKVPGVKVLGKCEFLNPGFSIFYLFISSAKLSQVCLGRTQT